MTSNRAGSVEKNSWDTQRSANHGIDIQAQPDPKSASSSHGGYEPPQSETEEKLAAAFAEVLMLERVGRHDDFFELGGDSMSAVQLMLQLQEMIPGETLPLRAILEAPTVEQFAAWLRKDEGNDQQVLVRIRPGTSARPPFFCIHASDGTAVGMQPLARAMDENLPFYCLQAKGLDGSAPFATMEEAAEYCLNEIRKVQPHGPYNLGGYCFGGFVAFEIARTLEQSGESVPMLIMIDSFNPAYLRFKPTTKMLFSLVKFYIRRVGMHARKIRKLHPGGWLGYAGGRFKAMYVHVRRFRTRLAQVKAKQNPPDPSQVEIAPTVNAGFDQLLERLVKVGPSLASKFVPKPYRGSAVVFRVSERSDDPYDDYFLGWKSVIRGPMESFEIQAAHETILREPAVLSLAEIIDAKLRESSAAVTKELIS